MPNTYEIILRLSLACLLGGIVGYEREKTRHPAGLRTHILVCIGSTLVMLCNLYMFEIYKDQTNMDPTRLAAQVISGIGFLGAGTILKEGVTIKGLTTAASLWTVACIGIAIGTGFYVGGAIATALALIILVFFSKFEYPLYKHAEEQIHIKIKSVEQPGQIGRIGTELGKQGIVIKSISLESAEDELILINITAECVNNKAGEIMTDVLSQIEGIKYFEIC